MTTTSRSQSGIPVLCGSLSRFPSPLGRVMHEAAYRALGLDYRYQPFEIHDVRAALDAMRALGIRGCGVSMPFKLAVLEHLDDVDPLAAQIGAVNTVVNQAGRLTGYNTDAWGARAAFEEERPLEGARVLLLGAGGAARAVAFAFREAGARLTIVNRSATKARELARAVGAEHSSDLSLVGELGDYDAVVNASSVGMTDVDPSSPVPARALRSGLLVQDIVYKPTRTTLVRDALSAGCPVVHGGRMLLHQATRQFELYTGETAPRDVMDRELRRALGEAHLP